ncbi:MAG: YkgJ family cysteine cluster protein [Thermodesulfobacteriota bacterium]
MAENKGHSQAGNSGKTECRRCGTCCRQGGPALHGEDRTMLDEGVLSIRQLVAVRYLEPALDPLKDEILPSRSEFLKVRGQSASWACIFFDQAERGCSIYGTRPLECRLLFCRDTAPLEDVLWKDLLTRRDLLAVDDPVLSLIQQLDDECSYELLNDLLTGAKSKTVEVVEKLSSLVRLDLAVRDIFLNSFPERQSEELFLFGRPLFLVLAPYGFRLIEGPGGVSLRVGNPSR